MGGIEVAVREPIAHSGDISPGDLRLGREETLREVFDGLADLDEAHPHGVEHESVIESTTIEVRPDRQDRGSDVVQPVARLSAHSGLRSGSTARRT